LGSACFALPSVFFGFVSFAIVTFFHSDVTFVA
jgi:hypothetical protein